MIPRRKKNVMDERNLDHFFQFLSIRSISIYIYDIYIFVKMKDT